MEPADRSAALALIAARHKVALPGTPSSRAGEDVLRALYEALAQDASARLVEAGDASAGGFVAGTLDLRATEARVRARMARRPWQLARLAVRNLLDPRHVLARRRWESRIPPAGAGYVLTIGVTSRASVRGRALLDALEDAFAESGALESWVDTEATNGRALAFYGRCGYREVDRAFGQVLLAKALEPRPHTRGEGGSSA